ncbi:MAG: ORF6N domain-containing protein [Candidatus Firestonebacteria bacterium]
MLNRNVRRNIERFPDDFMFSLKRDEIMNLSQIGISSIKHAPNVLAFTRRGVSMLSSVLNSKRAIRVNIANEGQTPLTCVGERLRLIIKKIKQGTGTGSDRCQSPFCKTL